MEDVDILGINHESNARILYHGDRDIILQRLPHKTAHGKANKLPLRRREHVNYDSEDEDSPPPGEFIRGFPHRLMTNRNPVPAAGGFIH